MALKELIHDPAVPIGELAAYLDALAPEERLAQTRALSRRDQRRLYDKAKEGPPSTLEDFVPGGWEARRPVHHLGRNTLPVPPMLKQFEKRFCRPEGASDRLFGFNEGTSRPLIGPGYFVAKPTAGEPKWEARGGVVVDYFEVPDAPVADGWPKVVPNWRGLQWFVFHRTRDFMRRVSQHVSIGAAYKGEWALDHYFVLCRAE